MHVRSIAFVGIYPPTAPRDKVYIEELKRRGIRFLELIDQRSGFKKYTGLFRALRALRDVDLIWIGYLSPRCAIVAYLAQRKKIIYNALASSYEAYILDREMHRRFSLHAFFFWLSDFLAFAVSDAILVESEAQKRFIAKFFFVPLRKLHVVFTGADESVFHPDPLVKKNTGFTVLFRGMFLPATGAEYVIEAARLLRNEPITFILIGWGAQQEKIKALISRYGLSEVKLIGVFLDAPELRRTMLSAQVLLGQFSDNERLDRTIQHKTIEALALGMPFITRDSKSNRELLSDGLNCSFVRACDAEDLAHAIVSLKNDPEARARLSRNAHKTYQELLLPAVLGERVAAVLRSL